MNGDSVFILVVSAVLIALGVLFVVKPLLMWKFTESWKPGNEDGPQPGYLRFARVFGCVLALIGIGVLIVTVMSMNGG